jgi:hypothetical protein
LGAAPSFFAPVSIGKTDWTNFPCHIDRNANIGDIGRFKDRYTVTTHRLAVHQNFKLGPSCRGRGSRAPHDDSANQRNRRSAKKGEEGAVGRHRKASFNVIKEDYQAKIS